jgi:hypothetical protein
MNLSISLSKAEKSSGLDARPRDAPTKQVGAERRIERRFMMANLTDPSP